MSEMQKVSEDARMTPTTTSEERTMAALAHISTLITILIGLPTGGLSGVLFVFVPFVIYLAYKDRSQFVARQAAQAFALQLAVTVGWFIAIVLGAVLMVLVWVISGILVVLLVGFVLLVTVAPLATVAIILIWIAAPFVVGVLAIVGTVEAANGHDYQYPYIGAWVDDWMRQHQVEATQQV